MFEGLRYNPSEFAAAYIQTLPHAMKAEEFENDEAFEKYLDDRRSMYFHEYLKTLKYAYSFKKSNDGIVEE
ncbi:hypothetical protein KYI07_07760 [Macrococcus psychrotolerans]|uniref:YozE SAM-like domain-containing protein n=1 Tax=Macrococcus psychrotolerans TaxID=3039389 RepID=A0AAT9P4M4_9STAP|nr:MULTISPECIES: hypothetical protein [Macrococcus]QYA32281.1 hypothetical protein KYI10_07770 [Macrococcus sp. 19Msa1099]QYA37087.1 hypothetical protein KYI07_07760 [Macrococcus caseolyticus]QYA75795.1 hypothetical protein KYI12_07760 [Macrococcus caseolyticus]